MQKVYIVLLNYNGWQDTQECLESVLKLEYPNYQIIVVDNNSPNDSMSHLLAWAKGDELATIDNTALAHLSTPPIVKPVSHVLYDKQIALNGGIPEQETQLNKPIVFIQAGDNRGFAAGNNIGIRYALSKGDASYIWCLNNDTVVGPNALTVLVAKARKYNETQHKTGIIGSKLFYYDRPNVIQGVGGLYNKYLASPRHLGVNELDVGQYDCESVLKQTSYPLGASMFVATEFIESVGLMSEEYFLYFEEQDWVIRGKDKGWDVGYCWEPKIYHKEGATIGSDSSPEVKSELSDYYWLRSRIIFTNKFYPWLIIIVRLGFVFVLFNRIRRGQFSRIKTVLKAFLG